MGQVIKMQAFKEWKNGLITTEQLLKGMTFFPEGTTFDYDGTIDSEIAQDIDIPSQNIDWLKMEHHEHCCCDDCAPTKEERDRRAKAFYQCNEGCICFECSNKQTLEEFYKHHIEESLAPSDSEE